MILFCIIGKFRTYLTDNGQLELKISEPTNCLYLSFAPDDLGFSTSDSRLVKSVVRAPGRTVREDLDFT